MKKAANPYSNVVRMQLTESGWHAELLFCSDLHTFVLWLFGFNRLRYPFPSLHFPAGEIWYAATRQSFEFNAGMTEDEP